MRVVVPFVRSVARTETLEALRSAGRPFDAVSIHPDHDGAYAALIERLWAAGEAFCVVEHDVVPVPAMLDELEACSEDWCSHCYDDGDYPRLPMLGLARFSAALLARRPEVGVSVLRTGGHRTRHVGWRSLNETICHHLGAHGEPWHRHLPDVDHLHRR